MKKCNLFSLCFLLFISTSLFAQSNTKPDHSGKAPYHYITPLKTSDDISSAYPEHIQYRSGETKNESVTVSGGDWAFAYNAYDPNGIIPEGTVLFTDSGLISTGGTVSDFLCAGTFDAVDQTWYACGYPGYDFYQVNYLTGYIEFIGNNGGIGIRGLAYDLSSDQLYGVDANNLYLVDKTTGSCTLIGPSGLNLDYIALACSPAGLLYGFDMNNDALYLINNSNGTASMIGIFPFDVIYAQGADFDVDNNILYWTSFNSGLGTGYLFIVDPTNANIIFSENIGLELDALGIYSPWIPVELISFTEIVKENNVTLSWTTATETNNQGFEILRKHLEEIEWETIGFVEGNGSTTEPINYSFIDKNVQPGVYQYKLKQIDFDGTFKYSSTVEVEIISPSEYQLYQNYPNPFNPSTVIGYQLPVSSFVTMKVYDTLGKEVASLVNEYKIAGKYEVEFSAINGQESSIRYPASGIYFYQLRATPNGSQASDFIQTRKMILIK